MLTTLIHNFGQCLMFAEFILSLSRQSKRKPNAWGKKHSKDLALTKEDLCRVRTQKKLGKDLAFSKLRTLPSTCEKELGKGLTMCSSPESTRKY